MTPLQIAQVQQSWSTIAPSAETIALLFQQRLEKTAPELTQTFSFSKSPQAAQLFNLFNTAIATLDLPENLAPALGAIGQRLRQEGVSDEQMSIARDALLWTLFRALPGNSPETREAWQEALDALFRALVDTTAKADSLPCLSRNQRDSRAECSGADSRRLASSKA